MKALDEFEDREHVDIFENTPDGVQAALESFRASYGEDIVVVTRAQVEALLAGKMWAYSDGEYSHFIVLDG